LLTGAIAYAYMWKAGKVGFRREYIWSIGIYTATDPATFAPYPGIDNPVLDCADVKDIPASFVADPFMIRAQQTWYMFFEVLNSDTDQGDIGYATSEDGLEWEYEKIVLDEPFHLSYPYVFQWDDSFYMIPESRRAFAVRLYKATNFPVEWSFVQTLLSGNYADPSLVHFEGQWWLFALEGGGTLTLHYADNLLGPFAQHPLSPLVVQDRNTARPGGRLIVAHDKPIRYAQDCEPTYGNQIRVFEIEAMTTSRYVEREITTAATLTGTGYGWNADGMHHIDLHQVEGAAWIACVDGLVMKKVAQWWPW
jgi:hypothetical protein